MSLPSNFSVLAIPGYYILSMMPHVYAVNAATGGDAFKWDNRCPRASGLKSTLQSKLPPDVFARYERGEAASANCYENMPIFFASIIMGHIAGLDKSYLITFALRYLLVRTVYLFSYIGISNQKFTPIRTLIYFVGLGLCIKSLLASAEKLA